MSNRPLKKLLLDQETCQEDGLYSPSVNLLHHETVKAGEPFPLYRGRKVRWVLSHRLHLSGVREK